MSARPSIDGPAVRRWAGSAAAGLLIVALSTIMTGCGVPAGTPSPSSSAGGVPSRAPATATGHGPPAAILAGLSGGSAPGVAGSWTLDGSGSDGPWLPASALVDVQAPSGARLEVRLATGEGIGAWSARAASAADTSGERPVNLGGRESAEPALDHVTVEPLGPGRWVLSVRLATADGRGDATYYWLVRVG